VDLIGFCIPLGDYFHQEMLIQDQYIILSDARKHLKKDGKLFVVTIASLRQSIQRDFKEIFGNYDKIIQGREYVVYLGISDV